MLETVLKRLYKDYRCKTIIQRECKDEIDDPFLLTKEGRDKKILQNEKRFKSQITEIDKDVFLYKNTDNNKKVGQLRALYGKCNINPYLLYFTLLSNDNSEYSIKDSDFEEDNIKVLAIAIAQSVELNKIDDIKDEEERQRKIREATQASWEISDEKLEMAYNRDYIFSINGGVIYEILEPDPEFKNESNKWNWRIDQNRKERRYMFSSIICEDDRIRSRYLNKKLDKSLNLAGSTRYFPESLNKYQSEERDDLSMNEILNKNQNEANNKEDKNALEIGKSRNRIVFGAPGTGKSHRLEEDREKHFNDPNCYERVTFHPNYSYSNFVGTYKPVSEGNEIKYKYVPGPFLRVLVKALKDKSQNYLLLIEEINRANVAAVFGDVFQLLDRNKDYNSSENKDYNSSEYPIDLSEDVKRYLEGEGVQLKNGKLYIPSNMYIWATMNSADQGVFPMDTAFKRRWDFEYIGIDEEEKAVIDIDEKTKIELKALKIPIPNGVDNDGKINKWKKIAWNSLRTEINNKLINSKINEDKLLGPFFLSPKTLIESHKLAKDENANITKERFVKLFESKVIMYLFEDVMKIHRDKIFKFKDDNKNLIFSNICKEFEEKAIDVFNIDTSKLEVEDLVSTNEGIGSNESDEKEETESNN